MGYLLQPRTSQDPFHRMSDAEGNDWSEKGSRTDVLRALELVQVLAQARLDAGPPEEILVRHERHRNLRRVPASRRLP